MPDHLGPMNTEPVNVRPPFDRRAPRTERRSMGRSDNLAAVMEAIGPDVELGDYDRKIIEWLAGWDTAVIGTMCSLFYRLRAAEKTDRD